MSPLLPFKVPVKPGPPRNLLWTVDQFHALGDLGCFEGRRAWLMNGVIIEEGPMNPPHAVAATKTEDLIRDLFRAGHHVRVAKPLVVGKANDPEPDVAVVAGKPGDYASHPTTAVMVIEIADSSLNYDVRDKAELYATADVPDYWVLDVDGRQLHVLRDPQPIPDSGRAYRTHLTFGPADSVAPLAAPGSPVRVADLLP
jgi:Uma2 family endonuclease